MNKPSTHCCECHGPFGEHAIAHRWPGSRREYCQPCWDRVGQFRGVAEIGEGMQRIVIPEGEAA